MRLLQQIKTDLVKALKEKDELTKEVLRFLISTIKNKEIDKHQPLTDPQIIQIIRSQIKKENEEKEYSLKLSRDKEVQRIENKIKILKKYLPATLSEKELKERILAELSEEEIKKLPFGVLMGKLIKKLAGQVDNSQLAKTLKELINEKDKKENSETN